MASQPPQEGAGAQPEQVTHEEGSVAGPAFGGQAAPAEPEEPPPLEVVETDRQSVVEAELRAARAAQLVLAQELVEERQARRDSESSVAQLQGTVRGLEALVAELRLDSEVVARQLRQAQQRQPQVPKAAPPTPVGLQEPDAEPGAAPRPDFGGPPRFRAGPPDTASGQGHLPPAAPSGQSPWPNRHCRTWYAVWATPGASAHLRCGLHGGPRAWEAIEERLAGRRYVSGRDRLRGHPTYSQCFNAYLDEAARHSAPTGVRAFWWH